MKTYESQMVGSVPTSGLALRTVHKRWGLMSSYGVQKSNGTNLYKQTGLSKGLKLILCNELRKSVEVFMASPTGYLAKIDAVQRHSRKLTAMTRRAFRPGGAHIIHSLCIEPFPIKTQTEYGMTCKVLDAGLVLKYHSSASVCTPCSSFQNYSAPQLSYHYRTLDLEWFA